MDIGSCSRCSIGRRLQADKGSDCPPASGGRAGCDRQGGLDTCIPPHAPRGTSSPSFPGEVNKCGPSQQAFRPASASPVDCSGAVLFEGSRGIVHSEDRDCEESWKASACNSGHSFSTGTRTGNVTKEKAKVSKETKGKGPGGLEQSNCMHAKGGLENCFPLKLISGGLLTGNFSYCPKCRHKLGVNKKCKACGFSPDSYADGIRSGPVVDSLTFGKWCALLTVAVLRTRSPFPVFLRATLHLSRSALSSVSSAFPLPIPYPGIFAKMPPGLSSAKRRRVNFRRALHVVTMALNFWWSGNCFIPLEHLERAPSTSQRKILHRLASLMLADGPSEAVDVLRSGRRFHQLV